MDLVNKVALVTGGTRGIGASAAILFAQRGADVAVVGRAVDDEVRALVGEIEATGRRCLLLSEDVGDPEAAARCVAATVEAFGGLEILVHSAGGPHNGRLEDIDAEVWYRAFDVHVHAAFHLCRAAIPHLRQVGEGAIVLVSSVAGIRGCDGIFAYGVVKGTVLQFTRMLGRELADDNIRVNCVAPGIIRTRFHDGMSPEKAQYNMDHRIPLHREGKPEDVGAAIVTLAENDYITGECLVVDGGLTSRIA